MGDTVPINGVITGPRGYRWHPLEPATLVWVEALDKGDIKNKVPHRDRIVTLKAPFTGEPTEVAKTEWRYGGVQLDRQGHDPALTETDRATRTTRTWVMTSSWSAPRKLWDRKQQDCVLAIRARRCCGPARAPIIQIGDYIYLSRPGRLAGRRSAVPRSPEPEDAGDRAPLPQPTIDRYETVVALLRRQRGQGA